MGVLISFQNVDKAFGSNLVYQGLNLEIQQGETITVLGGSGTGKSVLLKMLLGLLPPDRGNIFFNNLNITQCKKKQLIEIRRRMGMLFQGAALFDSLNVFENIAYPLREHFDYSEEKIRSIVQEKLEMVGLPGSEKIMPADLSGGMKKRVGLARAIATDPQVILYDEPTTGLDPANIGRIDQLILRMQEKLKVTSIVVTHDLPSAFRISNRLALVYNRKIEFVGAVEEFKNSKNKAVTDFCV
ncbi:MAG: ABC transporter ATP-binding protein [Deltaproteobacteria bacterium]|nr:ABC transporter ATP-binding protein [Deltaproteobacteria bacterium]